MTEETEYWEKVRAVTREHATRVGEVTLAWVHLHMTFAIWFTTLSSPTKDITLALREWDITRSDRDQRNGKLLPWIKVHRNRNPAIMDSIVWVLEWANELAKIRNAFVHSVTVVRGLPENPHVEFMEQLHLQGDDDRFKLVKGKLMESYDALMHDLVALSDFTHRSFNSLTLPKVFGEPPGRPDLAVSKLFPDIKPIPL